MYLIILILYFIKCKIEFFLFRFVDDDICEGGGGGDKCIVN